MVLCAAPFKERPWKKCSTANRNVKYTCATYQLPKDMKNQRNGSKASLQEKWRRENKAAEGKQETKSKGKAEGTLGWTTQRGLRP